MADTIVSLPRRHRGDVIDTTVGWVIAAVIGLALAIGVFALLRNPGASTEMPSVTVQAAIPSTSGSY